MHLDVPGFFRIDYILLMVVIALLIIGLVMVWSITFQPSVGTAGAESDWVSQAKYAVLGLLLLIVVRYVDYRVWGKLAVPLMAITLIALLALFFATPINGSRRWLFNGSVQPSEFAKFAMIVYMARWLSSKGDKLRNVTYGLLPFAIIVGGVAGLIMLQPNLSTAMIIALCALAMFFIAGADVVQFALLLIIGGVTVLVITLNLPYAFERIVTFLQDPFAMTDENSYQVSEMLIALGAGGLLGRGLGSGYAKFGFVPAPHTDGIFALLGEEVGLVGTWLVLGLFLLIVYRGFRIAAQTEDPFGQVLAAGLTFWLIFQAFINIGVVTATLPVTGVPLPLISFGGSSLIATLTAIGVLLNISASESKATHATFNFGWRNGRARVSRSHRRRRTGQSR